jgi:hypothetical protein
MGGLLRPSSQDQVTWLGAPPPPFGHGRPTMLVARSGPIDTLRGLIGMSERNEVKRLIGSRRQKYRPKAVSLMAFPEANAGKRELR